MSKPALGRGLGALLGGAARPTPGTPPPPGPAHSTPPPDSPPVPGERIIHLAPNQIRPSPLQPRKDFPPEALDELAQSIREQGIVQPLIVRLRGDHYELIAGERRWRAAQLAELTRIPAILREADDRAVLELALIENLQRENLNPVEEAQGYAQLAEQFQLRQEDIATRVGRSRAAVANALRLLKLPGSVLDALRSGALSTGHAKVLLSLDNPAQQDQAARRILDETLSVRQTEELISAWTSPAADPRSATPTTSSPARPPRDLHVADLEQKIQERLGTRVGLRYRKGKGSIDIRFFSDEDLERILKILGVNPD